MRQIIGFLKLSKFMFVLATVVFSRVGLAWQDDSSIVEVRQAEYIITNFNQKPFVQTYGLGPCIALIFHDLSTQMGALAHIDASTDVEKTMAQMITNFFSLGANMETTQVQLIGGWAESFPSMGSDIKYTSPITLKQIKKIIKRWDLKIIREETLTQDVPGAVLFRNLTLDLKNGKVYDFTTNIVYKSQKPMIEQREWSDSGKVLLPHPESLDVSLIPPN